MRSSVILTIDVIATPLACSHRQLKQAHMSDGCMIACMAGALWVTPVSLYQMARGVHVLSSYPLPRNSGQEMAGVGTQPARRLHAFQGLSLEAMKQAFESFFPPPLPSNSGPGGFGQEGGGHWHRTRGGPAGQPDTPHPKVQHPAAQDPGRTQHRCDNVPVPSISTTSARLHASLSFLGKEHDALFYANRP
jgi:hypothetical protein